MPEPKDKALYERVKAEITREIPKHSAYRSGMIVKEYKRRGGKYIGKKPTDGLTRWFAEDWKNQRGETGYSKPGDVYRPTKRVTSKTPATFGELSKSQIEKARREKAATGRVTRFQK